MTLVAKCTCGHNFYHCDGDGKGWCVNKVVSLKKDEWWKPDEVTKRLKELRKLAKRTLRQVENETGVSNAYLSQMENGKIDNPSYEKVYILKEYYERCLTPTPK